MTDKIETKNKMRLFDEKNSLVAKREKLRAEIVTLNAARPFNIPIYRHQDPFLKPTQDKFKAKKLSLFNNIKENLQKFFIKIQYYQRFY